MRSDFFYASKGAGDIHACRWTPEGAPIAVLQIIHGIADFSERYDNFANYLTQLGYLVVAEDHMGHGQSINGNGVQGYFHGGWFTAVADTFELLQMIQAEYPNIPYVLFGHSMGSFMARTILCKYPNSGISAAIICGTGWQPRMMLPAIISICDSICKKTGEQVPNEMLQKVVFGSYNKKVEHPRTESDWLSRDAKVVDDYVAHPLCGFTPSCGLIRDMLKGIRYIEDPKNLSAMEKNLPVLFIGGGDDPVGSYGNGVIRTAQEFQKNGMTNVMHKIYPLCRHEILNEINKEEIYQDITSWLGKVLDV